MRNSLANSELFQQLLSIAEGDKNIALFDCENAIEKGNIKRSLRRMRNYLPFNSTIVEFEPHDNRIALKRLD